MNDIDPYKVRIGGVIADPYRIAISFGLDSAIGEAAKKLLRCGRKHKDLKTDVQEAIKTLTRWLEIQDDIEREASIDSLRYVPSVPNAANAKFDPAKHPEAVPGGVTYAGPTQEQITERNKKLAHDAAISSGFLQAQPAARVGIGPYTIEPPPVFVPEPGAKTKMEEILDSKETTWP